MRTFDIMADEAVLHLKGDVSGISASYIGWDYQAQLWGTALQVTVTVSDDDAAAFIEFFELMAMDLDGWDETRGYESLDGTLTLAATHDRVSSVRLEVRLRGDARSGFDWSASQRMTLQLGQLEELAAAARSFASVGTEAIDGLRASD